MKDLRNIIKVETEQQRYHGTDYYVSNIPEGTTREEVLNACGVGDGWWVIDFSMHYGRAHFNVNYD